VPGKFIGFFRLIDACHGPGCPICRCLAADTRHYLKTVLYEHVTDPESRGRLRASWGFCNWHAWMLPETSDAAFGAAIVYEDLLRAVIRRFERARDSSAGRGPRLLKRLGSALGRRRPPLVVHLERRKATCPACVQLAEAEIGYVETALRFVRDPEFERAYRASHGLCVPHALAALERGGDAAAEELLARTLPKWTELRGLLASFVEKHDHRNRAAYTEAEGGATVRAFETLTGMSGLFPNQRQPPTRAESERPRRRSRGPRSAARRASAE
jgi:hypothetical protein